MAWIVRQALVDHGTLYHPVGLFCARTVRVRGVEAVFMRD